MTKELIISANVHEKKVAIVEDGVVTEFYVERGDENQGVVGNLYKGKVMKVLPGMQSAFVDISLERDAFLYVSDFTELIDDEEAIEFKDVQPESREPRDVRDLSREPRPQGGPQYGQGVQDRNRPGSQRRDRDFRQGGGPQGSRPAQSGPPPREHATEAQRRDEEALRREEEARSAEATETQIKDAVEQLAEIVDESVIPIPSPEEEIELDEIFGERSDEFERVEDEAGASEDPFEQAMLASEPGDAPFEAVEDPPVQERGRKGKKGRAEPVKPSKRPSKKGARAEAEAAPSPKRGGRKKAEAPPASEPDETDSSFERITDEELAETAGDLLKDAILQERIVDRRHQPRAPKEALPVEEIRVGSLRSQILTESGFERIVDADEERSIRMSSREDAGADSPDEGSGSVSSGHERAGGVGAGRDDSGQSTDRSDDQEEDREAKVSGRRTDSFFAIRRGGRNRRRGPRREPPQNGGEKGEVPTGEEGAAAPDETAEGKEDAVGATTSAPDEPVETAAAPAEAPAPSAPIAAQQTAPGSAPIHSSSQASGPPPRQQYRSESRPDSRPDTRPDQRPDPRGHGGQRRPEQGPPGRDTRRFDRPVPTISELLHEGQEILVQIAKEPIAKKGARITSHIALPGRYVVYMPTVNHVGVSRKISSENERIRLKRVVSGVKEREGGTGGFIVRTACEGVPEAELQDDMKYLLRTWADVKKKAERVKSPALVHRDLDLVQRILRDHLSEDFSAIRIDNEVEYARLVEFINRIQPKMVKRVKLYTGDAPILEKYGIQPEIDKAVKPRVWLKSGGYIVINQTEALVAIDVNTGKFVGKSDRLEDTITRTNVEAVKEIVRQIRLRDLGGIIVLDLIDMEERKNRQKVMTALQQELQSDRAPSKILSINDFGLVAITRKRVKQSLERTLCTPCPYCQGGGLVKSPETVCFEILEQAKGVSKQAIRGSDVTLRVSPDVAEAFRTRERDVFEEIEAYFSSPVNMEADPTLHREQYDFAIV